MDRRYVFRNLLSLLFLPIPFFSFSTVIPVPSVQPTIQSAIDNSTNGDTILVDPGTYFENINFRGHNILLTSRYYLTGDTSFICSTIINGSQPQFADTASCVIINSGEDSTAILQGFTITGGAGTKWLDVHGAGTYREGGGILVEFSSPVIRHNFITGNIVTNVIGVLSTGGGGIRCGDGSPHITGNLIAYNQGRYGGGVVFNYCDQPVLDNNVIVHNSGGQSFGGGGVWATGSGTSPLVYITNNTIAQNHVSGAGAYGGKGGGIFVFSVTMLIKNNIIWGNSQVSGNTIAAYSGGVCDISYSDVDMVLTGQGNMNIDPLFADSAVFMLAATSPCIDAGDSSVIFQDLISAPNAAAYPSQGTERNDMGAYGGQLAAIVPLCQLMSGIEILSSPGMLRVFPNPAMDRVQICSSGNAIGQYEIYDLAGRLLISNHTHLQEFNLDVSTLKQGIYFLKSDQNRFTKLEIIK